jgi:hypothetical protein
MFKKIAVIVMIALFAISGNALAQTAVAGASVNGVNANANSGASANNSQGQDQSQGQGQTQGVGIDQFNNSFNSRSDAEKIGKSFVVPGSVQYGPAINYFGKGGPTAGFQDIRTLLMYGCLFTEGALEEMSSGASTFSGRVVVRQMNATKVVAKVDEAGTKWIKIVVSDKPLEGLVPALHVTAEADSRDVDMIAIMAKSALEALRKGANVLHVTAFGAARDTETRGWGIGFNSTMAKVFQQNDDASVVGTGGFGYSSAWAGMRDKPWLQGFGLVDANLELPKVEKASTTAAAATPAGQTGNHIPKKQ